ncbi:MAG TPA: energy transducer TonB [Bacteroidales bacterium]
MWDNFRNTLDFDDLLFKSRNKEYGAYQLRKKYNSVVIGGIILASVIMCSLIILPFVLTQNNDKVLRGGNNYVQVQLQNFEPPEEFLVPPAPPPPEAVHIPEIVKYIPPVVVDTILLTEPKLATNDELMSQTPTEAAPITGTGNGDDLFLGDGVPGGDEPFVQVEIMPSFRGGDISKFRDWVFLRTNYPQAAIDKKIRGTVFLTFIVEKDGSVSNVTVVKGVDPLLDTEAVRAISESPKWTPGLQSGQPVRVRFSIPLNFLL